MPNKRAAAEDPIVTTLPSADESKGQKEKIYIPFSALDSTKHIILKDRIYNVERFVHPGGPIMLQQALKRRCAWEIFVSHHPTHVIENFEELLPDDAFEGLLLEEKRLSEKENRLQMEGKFREVYSPFYATLKRRVEAYLRSRGQKPRDQPVMYLKAIMSILVYLFTFLLLYFSTYVQNRLWLALLLACVWGWTIANIGMCVMHDGNHGSFSNNWLMNALTGLTFDFMGGSSFVWRMIHTNGHHVNTNVEEKDPDIHTNEVHFRRIKESQTYHPWYRFQVLYLPLMYSMLIFEFGFRDFVAISIGGWGGVTFQAVSYMEWLLFIVSKIWYCIFNFYIPLQIAGVPGWYVALIYCVCCMVGSEILVLMFQVNHVTDIATTVHCEEKTKVVNEDWAVAQIRGSSNFSSGSVFWNHVTGGLNHQIEHHLFPTISHAHYPQIHPIVKETCEEFGLPYQSYNNFFQAVRGHFSVLWKCSFPPEDSTIKPKSEVIGVPATSISQPSDDDRRILNADPYDRAIDSSLRRRQSLLNDGVSLIEKEN